MIRLLLSTILLNSFFTSSGQYKSLTDGPYVFYMGRYIIIQSIKNGKLISDTLSKKNKNSQKLNVPVPGQPEVSFPVPLKASLNPEPSAYPPVEKMFVLSDIEGTFEGLNKLLLAGAVIDEKYNWIYGKGHLVICGDIFDRGDEVTACLWLLYKLEDEAKAQGGKVHVILGNHEIMNLSGDTRFVNSKYMEAAILMEKNYMNLYDEDAELGRWLRTKNIMEKIGDFLCMHGGVSEVINKSGVTPETINNLARPYYAKADKDSLLNEDGIIALFDGSTSPFWYRGYLTQPLASMAQVDSSLQIFNVKHIIVGHTIVENIQPLYSNKVIAMDVDYHIGNYQALVIEKDSFYRMNAKGEKTKLN